MAHVGVPDRRARGGVQGPDRAVAPVHGAFDDGELAVVLNVGQRGAAAGGAVQRRAPHLVALGVEDLDRVLVAPAEEAARAGGDPVGTAGEDGADGRGGVDFLVGVGAADHAAVVVVDAHVATVGVVRAEGETVGRRPTGDEVVRAGGVQITHGRGGEHAVGGELRPTRGRRPVGAVQRVGHLAQRAGLDERSAVSDRERRLHAAVGSRVAGRVGHHLVPQLAPVRPVRVVPAVDGRGRVAGPEVEVAVAVHRCRRVDGRASGDLHAVDTGRGRRPARVAVGAALARTDGAPGAAAPARDDRPGLQVEPVQGALPVTHLHGLGATVVEQHGRGFGDAARRVVENGARRGGVPRLGQRHWWAPQRRRAPRARRPRGPFQPPRPLPARGASACARFVTS